MRLRLLIFLAPLLCAQSVNVQRGGAATPSSYEESGRYRILYRVSALSGASWAATGTISAVTAPTSIGSALTDHKMQSGGPEFAGWTCGTTAGAPATGNSCGAHTTNNYMTRAAMLPTFATAIWTPASVANLRVKVGWVGSGSNFYGTLGVAPTLSTAATTQNEATLAFQGSVSANWLRCVAAYDGAGALSDVIQCFDTGVPVAADTVYTLKIAYVSSTRIDYFIDGASAGSITSADATMPFYSEALSSAGTSALIFGAAAHNTAGAGGGGQFFVSWMEMTTR